MSHEPALIAISVGNTRTQIGRFDGRDLQETTRCMNDDLAGMVETIQNWWRKIAAAEHAAMLIASVNDAVSSQIISAVADQLSQNIYQIGADIPTPIGMQLDPETITGIDRLLNAAAAYDILKQACIIVDAGTAVTVDFVDGEGTFHGGAIAPGARLQLEALHGHTAALPDVELAKPDDEPFGRNTAQAMLQGVYHGIRGMVWRLVEQYASAYGAYPTVIATGGDAHLLFDHDELVDRVVDDLTLHGMAAAARHALAGDTE